MAADSVDVWASQRLDLEVATAFLRLTAVWDVPSINISDSIWLGR